MKKLVIYLLILSSLVIFCGCNEKVTDGDDAFTPQNTDGFSDTVITTDTDQESETSYDHDTTEDPLFDPITWEHDYSTSFQEYNEKISNGEIITDIDKAITNLNNAKWNFDPFELKRIIHTRYFDPYTKEYTKGLETIVLEWHSVECQYCDEAIYEEICPDIVIGIFFNEIDYDVITSQHLERSVNITDGLLGEVEKKQRYYYFFGEKYYAYISLKEDIADAEKYVDQFRELCIEIGSELEIGK